MAGRSAIKEAVEKTHKEISTNVEKAVKDAVTSSPEAQLRAAAKKSETGDVIINRKGGNGRWSFFHKIEGQVLNELDSDNFESLCHEEGGGGEYMIKVKVPKKDLIHFGPYSVIGPTRQYAKSSVPDIAGNPFAGTTSGLIPGASSKVRDGENPSATPVMSQMIDVMQGYQKEVSKGQVDSADRQMAMMNQMMMMQQASAQQLMQVLAMGRQRDEGAGPSEESKMLLDKIRGLEERERVSQQQLRDRELQGKIEQLQQQVTDTKLATVKSSQPDAMSGLMGQIFSAQQNSTSQNTELLKEMLRMNADKPTQSDQIASILSSMIGATSSNIEIISKAAQAGLLGGSDSPVKDALVRSLEQVVDGLPSILQGFASSKLGQPPKQQHVPQAYVEGEEGDEYDEEEEEMPPPSLPHAPPPAPALPGAPVPPDSQGMMEDTGPMGGVQQSTPTKPAAPPEGTQQVQMTKEQMEELQRRALTDDEFHTMQRDQALTTILACIQNGVSPKEISARIWAHAKSPNRIAERWFDDPEIITQQIVYSLQIGDQDRAIQLIKDTNAFKKYLSGGGDPNGWPDTEYRPVKTKKRDATQKAIKDAVEAAEAVEKVEAVEVVPTGPEDVNEGVEVIEDPDVD